MDLGVSSSPSIEEGVSPAVVRPALQLPLAAIFWFLALVILLYYPVLKPMVTEWVNDESMGHAFFVPLVAGYAAWLNREKILAAPVKPCWPALTLVLWGFCQMLLGFLGADFFLARTAFLITIVGVVWTLAGTAVLRTLAFPLLVLIFMIRIPLFIYQQITFPLQSLASSVASRSLELIGIPVLQDGHVLQLPSKRLEVVEACSGIRSMLSLTFLSVAYSHLFERRLWMKVVLFLATVPIAIVANAGRVTLTGILTVYKPDMAEGAYHSFEGWVIFMVELVALVGLHQLLCRFRGRSHA
jgi:exosortase